MRKRSHIVAVVVSVIAVIGCWLLFVASSYSSHELWLCAAFTALTLFLTSLASRQIGVDCSPKFNQLMALWRLPWYVLSDTWVIFKVLVSDLLGKRAGSFFRFTRFCPEESTRGSAQAILATVYNTVSPNLIVIGVTQDKLLFHQLERSGVPRMIVDIEGPK